MKTIPRPRCRCKPLAARVLILLLAFASAPQFRARAEEKTAVRIDDIYRYDAVTELAVAPDQQHAVYVRHWAQPGMRIHRHALWLVDGQADNRRPLEEDQPDGRTPIYSPDGRWIVFLSTRPFPDGSAAFRPVPYYSDPATDIWLVPAAGGRAIPLAGKDKPYGRVLSDTFYGRVAFSPDGKQLVFVADDGHDPRTPDEIARRVTIVRDDQGEGYEGYTRSQVWVADLLDEPGEIAASRVRRVSPDDAWYGDPQWSPDGKFLVVHANRSDDRESVRYSINKDYNLWRIDVQSGEISQLTTGPGPEVSPRFAPDGQRLICLSGPRKGPHADLFNLMLIDLAASGPRSRILFDHHGPGAEQPPHQSPSFPLPQDTWLDDGRVYFNAFQGLESMQQVVNVTSGNAAAEEFSETELQNRKRRAAAQARLTPPSQTPMGQRLVAPSRTVRWKSFDGLQIDGVLTLPPEPLKFEKPYKLLLFPHGGPHSRSGSGTGFTVQLFAAHGYAVFQPNFRGTAGYGREFLDADRFDLGGGDMQDILTGIDYLVDEGIVDRQRQFVYGVSYGGFMTSWLIGHTNQFRAAAPQNAVTDLNTMWGLSDLQSWTEWEFGGLPWEVPAAMRRHSPLTYAPSVRTPTLILHSDHDRRCPLPMGVMFYRALKTAGVETEMVIYQDERHGIFQLPHQQDVYQRVLDWFARHDVATDSPE